MSSDMSTNGIGGHQSPVELSVEESKPTPPSLKYRKDDMAGGHPRAKRNRYIAIACNECKRRKIKCNGESPCQRCGNLSLDCVYAPNCCSSAFKDSDEYRQMNQHLASLQEQVHALYASFNNIQIKAQSNGSVAPPDSTPQAAAITPIDPQFAFHQNGSPTRPPEQQQGARQYGGPTSNGYYINGSTNGIQPTNGMNGTNGMHGANGIHGNTRMHNGDDIAGAQPKPVLTPSSMNGSTPPATVKDPLWSITQEDALRLCQVYADEVGAMYTLVDYTKATATLRTMFNFLDSMRRVGLMKTESERGDSFYDDETLVLKMVLAVGAVCEGRGQSGLGETLFENVRRIINGDDRMGKPATLKSIQLFGLIAAYYSRLDEEVAAYRFIGLAARQCFELGIQRQDVLTTVVSTADDLREAIRLFWAVYVLDRRYSFCTGMPIAIRDEDVDPRLPDPDDDAPFLKSKVYYCKVAMKVWTSVSGLENRGLSPKIGEMSWLDWQISQWQNSITPELRYNHLDFTLAPEDLSSVQRQLRLTLYLLANELRIQLYRPVLFTVTSILENRGYAQTVIEIAKDTIHTLSELDKSSTDIHVAGFHWFLLSAVAVLFLAVSHVPLEFSRQVREDFYLSLDLIKSMSPKSYVTKRLWKTIKNLKKIAPKLGLMSGPSIAGANDPHSSAAMAMAGLAGHSVDGSGPTPWGPGVPAGINDDNGPVNGQQLSYELISLFEAASGFGDAMLGKHAEYMINGIEDSATAADLAGGTGSFSAMWGSDAEFVKVMKECF